MLSSISNKNLHIIGRILPANRQAVKAYYERALAQGLSPYGIRKNLFCLAKLSDMLGKSFSRASVRDLEGIMGRLEASPYAANTKNLFRAAIKAYYGPQDPRVSWIRVKSRNLSPKLPMELISRKELEWLISQARERSKKALLAFLYDSALRPKEFLALKRVHIVSDELGMFVIVPGVKTPARTIYLTESKKWLDDIPFGKLTSAGLASFFKRMERKFRKRLYPYLLRHSRLTELSRTWSEAMVKKFAGWTQDSVMPRIYVHLGETDLRAAMLAMPAEPREPWLRWQAAPAMARNGGILFGA